MVKDFKLYQEWFSVDEILNEDISFTKPTSKGSFSEVASVFDIEASSFYYQEEKRATMYAWVFGINGKCCRGRTWQEFIDLLNNLQYKYDLCYKKRLIVYVHNLAYEFQWFKDLFKWKKTFSLDERKPIYAITDSGIEFRCSYILSGYKLETLAKNLTKYKINKAVGDLDYKLIRHSATPLNDKEWGYILNDGLCVMAYIQETIERLGSITKIPMTKTGYARNVCREALFNGTERYHFFETRNNLTLTESSYNQLKRTYTGGFTHANHNHIGKTLYNVSSFDFTSSYPSVMIAERYPMSKPIEYQLKDKADFIEKLNRYCCMFDVKFINIRAKVDYEHFISKSRCFNLVNEVADNGRIIEADELIISVTEHDFMIIATMYSWDEMHIYNFCYFYRGYLPRELVLTALKLYVDKTQLKNVEGKEEEYLNAKELLNSLYGMCVTDPCKDEVTYNNDNGWTREKSDVKILIDKYNKSKMRFLYYAWGVWVTSYAKYNLFTGINEFKNDYIYSDTDSIKVLNKEKHIKYIEEYNNEVTEKIKRCLMHYNIPFKMCCPKTIKGVKKPLGVWDYEGTYSMFKTLGAKRYMYVDDNELHITIAGVSKSSGAEYLMYKYKTLDNVFKHFKDNLIFPATYFNEDKDKELNGAGKLCHTYIDLHYTGEVIDYLGNVGTYDEKSSVHLEPTSYELSLESEFLNYVQGNWED